MNSTGSVQSVSNGNGNHKPSSQMSPPTNPQTTLPQTPSMIITTTVSQSPNVTPSSKPS